MAMMASFRWSASRRSTGTRRSGWHVGWAALGHILLECRFTAVVISLDTQQFGQVALLAALCVLLMELNGKHLPRVEEGIPLKEAHLGGDDHHWVAAHLVVVRLDKDAHRTRPTRPMPVPKQAEKCGPLRGYFGNVVFENGFDHI